MAAGEGRTLNVTAGIRNPAILALLAFAFIAKGLLLVPPAPDPKAQFNAARAIERLARVLGDQRPHSVDTTANDAVRERLAAELRALGLDPVVREVESCDGLPGDTTISCSLTRNLVAVIGANRPGTALLLNAHYDSTPTGPGAADDGIGVATMLEVAANLARDPPTRPVILLFNEGEEYGLNGASAFVEHDPLAARVGALINMESRGVAGPAWMFETDLPNGGAVADFAASSSRPYANSLTADFARLIPNYTDVTVFKQGRHWHTLSFAIVGNETRYHSPGDTVQALSRASVQHMGDQVLAATAILGGAPGGGQTVYADIAGQYLFALPVLPAAGLLALFLGGLIFLAFRGRALRRPILAIAAASVGGIVAAVGASWVGTLLRAGDFWRAYPLVTYLAVYATALTAMLWILAWIGRDADRERMRLAAWLLILGLGGLLALAMPGAMAFFILAPALALLGFVLPKMRTPLLWSAALLNLLMFAELAASIEMLLIDGPLWAVAPIAALAALPLLAELDRTALRLPAAAAAVLAIFLWTAALLAPRASADRPLAFTIDYVRDDGQQKAWWTVASKQAPLPTTFDRIGQWEKTVLPYSGRTRWATAAPGLDGPKARAVVVADAKVGNRRTVRLRLDRGGGDALQIRLPANAPVIAMGLPGKPRAIDGKGPFVLRCSGRACDGLEVEIVLGADGPIDGLVIGQRFALPPQGAKIARLRPADAHPQYGPDSSYRIASLYL